MSWEVAFYSLRLEAELQELPAGILARFLRLAERMETYGPDLGARVFYVKEIRDG